jgi:galactokinase
MSIVTCFAPGRVELLGNHTDYNEGYVLSAAIPFGVTVCGSRRDDGRIVLETDLAGERLRFEAPAAEPLVPRRAWTDYPLGVVHVLRTAGHPVGGFEAVYRSDLPAGAGLSSSAALEVATVLLLARLFGLPLSGIELATLCRRAENEFVGVPCGILDQVSSLFGRRDHAVFLDCRTTSVETIAFPRDVALLLVQSGVPHALVGGEYRERREQCRAAAERLGVPFLRDADAAMLAAADLPDVLRRRAAHVIGENERVLRTRELVGAGDVAAVGRLMAASHESSRVNFENSTPALDLLVSIALATPGVYGARLTGGGFGGAIVALVAREAAATAGAAIAAAYERASGHHATVLPCDLADGALARSGFPA